jgi:hypothetical protein
VHPAVEVAFDQETLYQEMPRRQAREADSSEWWLKYRKAAKSRCFRGDIGKGCGEKGREKGTESNLRFDEAEGRR